MNNKHIFYDITHIFHRQQTEILIVLVLTLGFRCYENSKEVVNVEMRKSLFATNFSISEQKSMHKILDSMICKVRVVNAHIIFIGSYPTLFCWCSSACEMNIAQ